jgi:hypothetical protein
MTRATSSFDGGALRPWPRGIAMSPNWVIGSSAAM